MKKLFIISDVHSFYTLLKQSLDAAGFDVNNPDHIIISCGDLCDRGQEAIQMLEFINGLADERKICVIGNHELLMEALIRRGYPIYRDIHNGTMDTAIQLTGMENETEALRKMPECTLWNTYKKSWRWFFEAGDMIFVHGWIPCSEVITKYGETLVKTYDPAWREASRKVLEAATWLNGMEAWDEGIREPGKTVFCGHWHSSWGHAFLHHLGAEFPSEYGEEACFDPFEDEGICALDGCTALSHQVNVVVREVEDEVWKQAVK